MSRQSHSKKNVTTILFLFVIASIGFPFQSIPTLTLNDNFYNLAVVNMLSGNGFEGLPLVSIFDDTPTTSIVELQQAFAQTNDTYPITTRYDNYEDTQITDTRHIAKLGLPMHILDNQGEYVANLVYEDGDGIELESGSISYYFDKSACAMSLFDAGRIDPTSQPLIKSDTWVTKVALNGTDTWSDVSQNNLPCVVTTDISERAVTINSTKSDVNGTMVEIYHYDIYKGMKSTVYFTNNDSSLNNHKFSFSNILMDTPQNLNFLTSPNRVGVPYIDPITNSSIKMNYYSMYDTEFQPYSFAGSNVEKIGDGNTTQTITLERDDMFDIINVNGTDYYEQVFGGFYWIEDQGIDQTRSFAYSFENEDDFGKLWQIKFVTQPDFTLDTYIDYANVTATLPVGNTTMIDPTIDTFTNFESFTTSIGSTAGNCNFGNTFSKSPTGFGISVSISISGTKPLTCGNPVMIFDITGIPDDATPIRGTLQINHTSYGCSTGSIFTICHTFYQNLEDWFDCSSEDLTVLPDLLLKEAIYKTNNICGTEGSGSSHFQTGGWSQFIGLKTQSKTLVLDPFIIEFEDRLESGSVRYNIIASTGGGFINGGLSPIGAFHTGGSRSGSAGSGWSVEGSFLEVEYDFFAVPSEPLNVVCSADTPTTVLVDWDLPLSDGGRPIDFYNIERDSGGGFTPLIQVPIFPTNFVDTTVIAGLGFTYRVAAENGEGVGAFSPATQSCGVVSVSDAPLSLTAQNQALNVVALDWLPPSFNGNDPIIGYKIDRTTGTPDVDSAWNLVVNRSHGLSTCDTSTFTQSTNYLEMYAFDFATNTPPPYEMCNLYMWQVFDKGDVEGRIMEMDWEGFYTESASCCALNVQKVYIFDGTFTQTANFNVINAVFPFGINALIDTDADDIPDSGNGLIQTVITAPQHKPSGFAQRLDSGTIDTSGASFDTVTIVISLEDNTNQGAFKTRIFGMDIDGWATWDFGTSQSNFFNPDPQPDTPPYPSLGTYNFAGGAVVLGDGFNTLVADTGNVNIEFLDTTVEESTNYGYRVFAINSVGIGSPSNVAVIFTAGAPFAPVITATPSGTQSILVDWAEPDLQGGTLVGYDVERKLGTGGIFAFIDTVTESEIDDGIGLFTLQSATEYCYRVKTLTNVGNSGFSAESCAITFSAPDIVENLVVTDPQQPTP